MQKMQEMEQLANVQGLPTDRNSINKLMAMHPGLNNQINTNHNMVGRGALSGSAQAALALSSYQNLLRQNSMNSNPNSLQQEASSSFNNSSQSPSSNFQGSAALIPGSMQNLPAGGFSSPHLPPQQPQQQLQQRSLSANNMLQQNHSQTSQGNNQALQHQMIQQLLHMSSNSGGGMQQQSLSGPNANGSVARNGVGFGGNNTAAATATANVSGSNGPGPAPSRSNSFKAASNSDSAAGGNNGFNQRSPDLPQNLHLQDDIVVPDISHDFTENGFLNSDFDDNMGYNWKA
jgi:hypothetical protein